MNEKTIVTGHQPVYLPWLGLFHKISLADTFIFMDDVQYLQKDWNNRNKIKTPHGAKWLTVPVSIKKSRIDKSVIMGLPFLKDALNIENNKYIYRACKKHQDKFIGLGILNPGKKNFVQKEVRKFKNEYGFAGVKVIASWQDFALDDKLFYETVEEIIKNNLILFPHIDFMTTGSKQDSPHHLLNLGKKFPELKILAPHLGGLLCLHYLFPPYRKYFQNMRFVTSVGETMKFVEFAAQVLEDHYLVFGTDFPFQPVHDQITIVKRFEELNIKKELKNKIYSKNLLDFLGR